jgi:glycosyltransferase involved in cell wall biosynthesis
MTSVVVPITLVLPVLNEAESLAALLEAVARQTRLPAEIIFADAGSTDGTPELIAYWWARHAWPGTVLRVLPRPGALPGAGRNHGIRAASHAWIAFLDGGTYPDPDWLERLTAFVEGSGGRAALGVCRFSADVPLPRAVCALSNGYLAEHPAIPASLFHREVFDTVGFFREDLRSTEDILWVREYERRLGPRPICATGVVHYVGFESSLSAIFRKWRIGELNAVRSGVRRTQQGFYLLAPLLLLLGAMSSGAATAAVVAGYFVARVGIDPIRRSPVRVWWRGCLPAVPLAFAASVCIDSAKWIGIVQGLLEKATARFGRGPV